MPYARTNFTETLIRKRVKEIAAYGPTYRSFNRRDSSFSCKGTMRRRLRNKGKFERTCKPSRVLPPWSSRGLPTLATRLYPLPLALPVATALKIIRGDSVQAEVRRLPTYQPQRLRRTRYNSGCPSIEVVPFGNPVLANFHGFYQYRSPFDRRPAEETERTETRGRGCGAAGRVATTASAPSFPSTWTTTTIVRKISRKCVLFCR